MKTKTDYLLELSELLDKVKAAYDAKDYLSAALYHRHCANVLERIQSESEIDRVVAHSKHTDGFMAKVFAS